MKFPALFRREKQLTLKPDSQDRAEKLLVESFRLLAQVCTKMADFVETQRLARAGYDEQGKFVERIPPKPSQDS